MKLLITVVHNQLNAYDDRLRAINSLKQFGKVNVLNNVVKDTSLDDHLNCLIVHSSQSNDVRLAKSHCAASGDVTRLVIFGAGPEATTPTLLESYGCIVPASIFVTNAGFFFGEWLRRGTFPGWDFLIGEPELEYALELLHRLLPSVYGQPLDEPTDEWTALNNFKDRFRQNERVQELWTAAQGHYSNYIERKSGDDPVELLAKLRDSLLGSNENGFRGLVGLLSQLRKS